jgi:hypothetical protein
MCRCFSQGIPIPRRCLVNDVVDRADERLMKLTFNRNERHPIRNGKTALSLHPHDTLKGVPRARTFV